MLPASESLGESVGLSACRPWHGISGGRGRAHRFLSCRLGESHFLQVQNRLQWAWVAPRGQKTRGAPAPNKAAFWLRLPEELRFRASSVLPCQPPELQPVHPGSAEGWPGPGEPGTCREVWLGIVRAVSVPGKAPAQGS